MQERSIAIPSENFNLIFFLTHAQSRFSLILLLKLRYSFVFQSKILIQTNRKTMAMLFGFGQSAEIQIRLSNEDTRKVRKIFLISSFSIIFHFNLDCKSTRRRWKYARSFSLLRWRISYWNCSCEPEKSKSQI